MQLSASPLHTAILRARSMMILFLCFWFLGRFLYFWFWSGFGVMAWVSWRLGGCGVVVWNGVVEWKKQKWVCSSNGRVIPSQGIGNGIDARLIQLFVFLSFWVSIWVSFWIDEVVLCVYETTHRLEVFSFPVLDSQHLSRHPLRSLYRKAVSLDWKQMGV